MKIELRELTALETNEIYEMIREIGEGENGFGNSLLTDGEAEFEQVTRRNHDYSRGRSLPPGRVPQTIYFLYINDHPVGYGKLRSHLTEELKEHGGHIGYTIRPTERNKGYGTIMLQELVKMAVEKNIEEVLLTCNENNTASRKVMESNNARLIALTNGSCKYKIRTSMASYPVLRTDRLLLRVIDEASAAEVLEHAIRNASFLIPWEPAKTSDFYTEEHQAVQLREERLKIEEGSLFKVWIYKENRIIGSIALSTIIRGAFQSCFVGYKLDEAEQGDGLMTEALRVVVEYGFQTLGLHRLEANIMPRNTASLRVVEKLGFRKEGISPKYLKINGVWEDHIHMVLLNEAMG